MMLIALALQATVALFGGSVAGDSFAEHAWAHFSRVPSAAASETVDIAVGQEGPAQHFAYRYTMRLTRGRVARPGPVLWADSAHCPAMQQVLESMRTLTPPHPQIPGIDPNGDIVLDGTSYHVRSHARFDKAHDGDVAFDSNTGTPLAAWVDQSLAALETCWSPRAPRQFG